MQQKLLTFPPFLLNQHSNQNWGQIDSCSCPSSVQLLSCVQLSEIPWTAAHQASLSTPTPRACSNSSQPSYLSQSGLICFFSYINLTELEREHQFSIKMQYKCYEKRSSLFSKQSIDILSKQYINFYLKFLF